ncbi:MAG: molybdenum cofactor biosynthesis protein B [Candidatus Puniceispirillaceae bacterium]
MIIIIVSDTRTTATDKSGKALKRLISDAGHNVLKKIIIPDDIYKIRYSVSKYLVDEIVDVIITSGGTGITGRDGTPEAVSILLDKKIEGFGEMFRFLSFQKIGTSTLQSRAIAGVAGGTYLFALPGSPSACRDAWDDLLAHQLDYRHRPCNFVEIMPRLRETGLAGRSSGK